MSIAIAVLEKIGDGVIMRWMMEKLKYLCVI